jgi:hypothetical protein
MNRMSVTVFHRVLRLKRSEFSAWPTWLWQLSLRDHHQHDTSGCVLSAKTRRLHEKWCVPQKVVLMIAVHIREERVSRPREDKVGWVLRTMRLAYSADAASTASSHFWAASSGLEPHTSCTR